MPKHYGIAWTVLVGLDAKLLQKAPPFLWASTP